jgi:hypothetical protein
MGWVQFMTSSCSSFAARGFPSREGDGKVDNQLDPGNGVRALGGRDHPGIRISQSPLEIQFFHHSLVCAVGLVGGWEPPVTIQSHSGASKHFATFGIASGNRKVWSVSDSLLGGWLPKSRGIWISVGYGREDTVRPRFSCQACSV